MVKRAFRGNIECVRYWHHVGAEAWVLLTSLVVSEPVHMSLVNRGGWLGFLPLSSLCKKFNSRVSPASRMNESTFLQ